VFSKEGGSWKLTFDFISLLYKYGFSCTIHSLRVSFKMVAISSPFYSPLRKTKKKGDDGEMITSKMRVRFKHGR
jgi:hypothetical protein